MSRHNFDLIFQVSLSSLAFAVENLGSGLFRGTQLHTIAILLWRGQNSNYIGYKVLELFKISLQPDLKQYIKNFRSGGTMTHKDCGVQLK